MFVGNNPYIAHCTAMCIQDFNVSAPASQIKPNKSYFLRFDEAGNLAETDVPTEHRGIVFDQLVTDCLHFLRTNEHPQWEIDGDQRFLETIVKTTFAQSDLRAMWTGQRGIEFISPIEIVKFGVKLGIKGTTIITFFVIGPGESFSSVVGLIMISIRGVKNFSYMTTTFGASRFEQISAKITENLQAMAKFLEGVPEIRKDRSTDAFLSRLFYVSDIPTGRLADLFKSIKNSDGTAFQLLKREVNALIHGLTMEEIRVAFSLATHPNLPLPLLSDEQKFQTIQSAGRKMDLNFDLARKRAAEASQPKSIFRSLVRGLTAAKASTAEVGKTYHELFEIDQLIETLRVRV